MVRHRRTHTKEKPFHCGIPGCGKSFALKSTLDSHIKTHGDRTYTVQCEVCAVAFTSKCALKAHMRIHTGQKPFSCQYCGKTFRTSGLRKSHIQNSHNNGEDHRRGKSLLGDINVAHKQEDEPNTVKLSVPSASLTQALSCVSNAGLALIGSTIRLQLDGNGLEGAEVQLRVDQSLLTELEKSENISVTVDRSNLTCMVESQNILALPPAKLDSSNFVPEPQEPMAPSDSSKETELHLCTFCDHLSADVDERDRHLMTAHGIGLPLEGLKQDPGPAFPEKYACGVCNKQFSKPSLLQRHERVHSGVRPFICSVCKKSFSQKSAMQVHFNTVHGGEKKFKCPFCSYPFSQKANLKTHIQRSHAMQAQILLQETDKLKRE